MGQFKFRLQQIQKIREKERDQAADSLQQAMLAAQQLEIQIDNLHGELNEQSAIQHRSSQGVVRTQQVLESQRYQLQLLGHLQALGEKLLLIQNETQRRRLILLECEKQVRVLQKLEEKQLQQWQQDQMKAQQRELDDWASYRHWESASTGLNRQEGA